MPSLTPRSDSREELRQGASEGPPEGAHLGTSRIVRPPTPEQGSRRTRYARRQQSSTWLIGAAREAAGLPRDASPEASEWVRPLRAARCRWRVAGAVGVHHSEGRPAHWSGVERCGSIWSCPVCSAVIRHGRALEIQEAADRWAGAGGSVLMVSLTTRHYASDRLATTLELALTGWRRLTALRAWKNLRQRLGVQGYVRSIEVTWSYANGWHPHVHALLFTERHLDERAVARLESEVFDLWSGVVASLGGRSLSREHGVRVSRGGSASYIAKVQEHDRGTGLEMARLDLKSGRHESLMPFELLDRRSHRARWIEYVETTHGRLAITWSRGLRTFLGMDAELTDEEVMDQTETSDLVWLIPAEDYDRVKDNPQALTDYLETAERTPMGEPDSYPHGGTGPVALVRGLTADPERLPDGLPRSPVRPGDRHLSSDVHLTLPDGPSVGSQHVQGLLGVVAHVSMVVDKRPPRQPRLTP